MDRNLTMNNHLEYEKLGGISQRVLKGLQIKGLAEHVYLFLR